VKVSPAIVSVPVRAAPGFAVALNRTCPLPVPLAPEVIVSHEALLVAVHAQDAVTEIAVPAPPAAPMVWLVELIDGVHDPDCVTVNVWPPIVTVPVRVEPVLAAAEIVTLPFPVPVDVPATPSHDTLLAAVHAQAVPA
jgi:hypothetical protein